MTALIEHAVAELRAELEQLAPTSAEAGLVRDQIAALEEGLP